MGLSDHRSWVFYETTKTSRIVQGNTTPNLDREYYIVSAITETTNL